MRTAGLWGLLWTLLVSELGAAPEDNEEEYVLEAGQNLTVSCPFNIWKYANSQKAWQRLVPGQEPLTLLVTERPSGKPSTVRMGRYELEDDPEEAMLHVRMMQLLVEDSGLYRCVIYHPPKDPVVLFYPVRLLVTQGSQAAGGEQEEEQKCLVEGDNLTVSCPYNIMQYATSLKAWQRVGNRGSLETLVRTETRKEDHNRAQARRYLLEDYPTHAILRVTMADLRRQDVGLYQCVIYLSSQQVVVLYHRIRLVQCQGLWMPATVLACGFILNKSLVFAVLLVFLCRGRAAS